MYFIAHRVLNLLFVEVVVYWVVVCLLRYGLLVLGGLSLSRLSVVVVVVCVWSRPFANNAFITRTALSYFHVVVV